MDARVHALRAGDRPPVRVGRAQLHGPLRAAQARGGRSAARARARARAVGFRILIVAAPCSMHWSQCTRRALRLGRGYRAAEADEPAPSSGLWVWACRLQQGDFSLADACVRLEQARPTSNRQAGAKPSAPTQDESWLFMGFSCIVVDLDGSRRWEAAGGRKCKM